MAIDFLDRQELERFDTLCTDYRQRFGIMGGNIFQLAVVYDNSQTFGLSSEQLSRRIALAFEIKLAHLHTCFDLQELAGLENVYLVDRNDYRPIESVESFHVAMRRSRATFGLVTRIRSVWDKVFLYIVLVTDGDEAVNRLQNSKSKRKYFLSRYANGCSTVSADEIRQMSGVLERLEGLRSPELHGFGAIRTWVFKPRDGEWDGMDIVPFMGQWSYLNEFLAYIFTSRKPLELGDGPIDQSKFTNFRRIIPRGEK